MASEELSSEAWLARGIEAYQKQRFEEAAEHFEKAVAMEAGSFQASLALGAARLTLYMRRRSPPSPDYFSTQRDVSESELRAYWEQGKALLAEQNSTNWPLAEQSLKRANQLNPEDQLAIEYLCVLYSAWRDPVDETNRRTEEAVQWLERLVELEAEHKFANFYCGLFLYGKARKLLPNWGRFPTLPEPDLESLRMTVGPLLERARRHFARAFEVNPDYAAASHFVDEISSMQAYLVDPDKAARDLLNKRTEEFNRHWQARVEQKAAGQEPPSGTSETITFRLSPEGAAEAAARQFPPWAWTIPVR